MAKSFHELPPRAQRTVFIVLWVLTMATTWQVLLGPAYTEIDAVRETVTALDREAHRARLAAMQLPAVQREVRSLEVSLRETEAHIPDEKDPQSILRRLHELTAGSRLDITSFKPKPTVAKAQYTARQTELGLEGSYHDLGHFLDRMAAISRLLSVSDLQIKTRTRPNGRGAITASCIVTTYAFHEDPTAVAGDFPPATVPVGARVGEIASSYKDGGRRDPFASLVVAKSSANRSDGRRPRLGLASLAIAEVTVTGIARSGSTMLAILEAPGKESFVARVNDELLDGSVDSIDSTGVVLAENTNASVPSRVRKLLRRAEEEVQ